MSVAGSSAGSCCPSSVPVYTLQYPRGGAGQNSVYMQGCEDVQVTAALWPGCWRAWADHLADCNGCGEAGMSLALWNHTPEPRLCRTVSCVLAALLL